MQGAVATRIYAIADPRQVTDPGYLQGLNDAMAAAIEYRLGVLEGGERQAPDLPAVLLGQGRLEAGGGGPPGTVPRRDLAREGLFWGLLGGEAGGGAVPHGGPRPLLAAQA